MNVSVVICAYTLDRWDALEAAVRSCTEQSVTPSEVIVVIDYNEELYDRASLELNGAEVVSNQMTKGLSGARNTGVAKSSGEIIAFLDDDAFAEPRWLQELIAPMSDPTVAGCGGWILPYWEIKYAPWFPETFYWILGCSYAGLPPEGAPIRNPIGANMAIRRSVFTAVGGFTSGIGRVGLTPLGCEETELCIRYTSSFPDERFQLARRAVVHHRVPASRLTWHYFWSRCWAEGLSKAAVSSLVGTGSGLSAERKHVTKSLPREIWGNARMFTRQPRTALTRTALVIAGTFIAAAGLFRGRVALRRSPLKAVDGENDLLLGTLKDGAGSRSLERPPKRRSKNNLTTFREPEHARDESPIYPRQWRPLVQVQVDVDAKTPVVAINSTPGQRVWVEVVKQGQVVGVFETRAVEEGLSEQFVNELKRTFSKSTSSLPQFLPDKQLPPASVVVPTIYRIPALLSRTVESLLALNYPEFEVIIVDNRVGDPVEPLPAFPGGERVRTIKESRPGASAARNRGMALATGEFVAFTDDDAFVDPNWLRALGTRFVLSPEVDAIGGLVLPGELATQPQLWFEEFYGGFTRSFHLEIMSVELLAGVDHMFPYAPGKFGAGCNMAIRRSTLEQRGGFDVLLGVGTPARGGEDLKLFMDIVLAGGAVAFEPAALVRHTHRASEDEFMDQVFGYGVGLSAMFTELIVRDPRRIVEIVRRMPEAFRLITKRRGLRSPSSDPSYPLRTNFNQLLGMLYGPLAYFLSSVRSRRSA